jgi:hypothetical protein
MIKWGVLTSIILAIFFCAGCATNQANDGSDRIKKKSIGIKDTETHKNELFHNESIDGNSQEKKVSPLSSDSSLSLSADSKREIKSKVSNEINKKSNNDKKKYSDQGSGSKKQKHFKIKEVSTLAEQLDKPAGKQKKGSLNQQKELSIQSYFSPGHPSHQANKKLNQNKKTEQIESGINRDFQTGNGLRKNLPKNAKNRGSLIGSLNVLTKEAQEKGDQDLESKSVGDNDPKLNKSNFSSGAKISKFDDSDTVQIMNQKIDRLKNVEFNDYNEKSEKQGIPTQQKVGFGDFRRESFIEFDRDAKSNPRIKNAQKENQYNRIRSFLQRNDDLRMSEGIYERSDYSNAKKFIDTDRSGSNELTIRREGKQGGAKYGKTLEWIEKRGRVKQSEKLNE